MRHRIIHLAYAARRIPLEAVIWTAGLVALACTDPRTEGLLSLCVLKNLGVSWCPGCGLGHSIAFLLHCDLAGSLQAHPLGPPAFVVLSGRTFRLLRDALSHPLTSVPTSNAYV